MPVIFKFTASHEIEGGRTLEEGLEIARMLEGAGISALHVDRGCHERYYHQITTVYGPEANKLSLASEIKRVVKIPVFCDGKLGNPVTALESLESGGIDFVALAKQVLAEPEWPNKVKSGALTDVRPCMYCNECHYNMHEGKYLTCSVNPLTGYEKEYALLPAAGRKKVLVIGGGPGGMQCALTAAERGFSVELWESRTSLGGTLAAAAAPVFKKDVRRYLDFLIHQLYKSGVQVRLGRTATPESVLAVGADEVVLATGAEPIIPNVPGVDKTLVKTAYNVLLSGDAGSRVIVVGGGLVGCETALMLAMRGRQVTIVEMMGKLLPREALNVNNEQQLFQMIEDEKIGVRLNTRLLRVEDDSAMLASGGKEESVLCDSVIMAAGYRSCSLLEESLRDRIDALHIIGDAVRPRKVYAAVHEGFHAARLM